MLKSLKTSPINYCKGQRGQSPAWKPAKSHQSAVRVRSISGTSLFTVSPSSLSLLPHHTHTHTVTTLSVFITLPRAFLQIKVLPLNPNILKFMRKRYVAHILTRGLLKHPGFSWYHFQCRFNAHSGLGKQISCLRERARRTLNRHGDFHRSL